MADLELDAYGLVGLVILAAIGYVIYYLWSNQQAIASIPGKAVQAVSTAATTTNNAVQQAGASSQSALAFQSVALQAVAAGYAPPVIPETPAGMDASDWQWTLLDGTQASLPAGVTPNQYCAQNPCATFCTAAATGTDYSSQCAAAQAAGGTGTDDGTNTLDQYLQWADTAAGAVGDMIMLGGLI